MKKILMFVISAALLFGSLHGSAANVAARDGGFTLKDQNNAAHAVKFPRDRVTVLIFGDREGAEQIEGWVRPIYDQYGDKIDVYGIAELSAVPGVARGIVRRVIKSKTKYSVLLDWSGAVSEAYGYEKGKANVVVLDKDGNVLGRRTGAANRYGLLGIYKHIDKGL